MVTWASLLSFIKPSTLPWKQVLWLIGSYILEGLTLHWCHSKWELVFSFHVWIVFIWYLIATLSYYMPICLHWVIMLCIWKLCHTFRSAYNEYISPLQVCLIQTELPPLQCQNRACGLQISSYVRSLLTILRTAQAQLAFLDAIEIGRMNSLN